MPGLCLTPVTLWERAKDLHLQQPNPALDWPTGTLHLVDQTGSGPWERSVRTLSPTSSATAWVPVGRLKTAARVCWHKSARPQRVCRCWDGSVKSGGHCCH